MLITGQTAVALVALFMLTSTMINPWWFIRLVVRFIWRRKWLFRTCLVLMMLGLFFLLFAFDTVSVRPKGWLDGGVSFKGGEFTSPKEQHAYAKARGYVFVTDQAILDAEIAAGKLVKLTGNENYQLSNVSLPHVRPYVKRWVERVAASYRPLCGEKLVVTSANRYVSTNYTNSSNYSVHPAGIAVDLRSRLSDRCRQALIGILTEEERARRADTTEEKNPLAPHFHVVVVSN